METATQNNIPSFTNNGYSITLLNRKFFFNCPILISFILFFFVLPVQSQEKSLFTQLKELPGVEIKKVKTGENFKENFILYIEQPLDHKNPDGKKFRQRVFLSHRDTSAPVVIVIEGYDANNAEQPDYESDFGPKFEANQIVVEHRYYGKSKPDTLEWKYLTLEQSAADYHVVHVLLHNIFRNKWISTGISKGGQEALCYRAYYPDDVTATVAYVASFNKELEDSRLDTFLAKAGEKKCRDKIYKYQVNLFRNKEKMLQEFTSSLQKMDVRLSVDAEIIFDYMTLEFPFSFWQYDCDCNNIPEKLLPPTEMIQVLLKVVYADYYSSKGITDNEPAFYQDYTELGFYKYNTKPFYGYLKQKEYPNNFFAPKNTDLTYRPETIKKVKEFIRTQGDRIVYIYGDMDPWTACAVEINGNSDALKIIKKGGNHLTFIENLPVEQKTLVYSALERWLGIKIKKE
ncbi:MAG: hypothetical protein HY958_01155 [Bacteroidia bacterium]|nr:hypothetical protein [Bacteroidia bacterium]